MEGDGVGAGRRRKARQGGVPVGQKGQKEGQLGPCGNEKGRKRKRKEKRGKWARLS